jgi:glycosyltransferase involved in cell wall biosynthesis
VTLRTGARVCLVTTGQPSTNPRAVKEADALVEAGYDVRFAGAHWAEWAWEADRRLLGRRRWECSVVDWRRKVAPALFWKSRVRHRLARASMRMTALSDVTLPAAAWRLTPELTAAAMRSRADLFIAHNIGALPAAAAAAARFGARLGFDAEDFHSGEFLTGDRTTARVAVQRAEARYVPTCDYVTAASPGIARAYARLSRKGVPTCVLNVFPLADRPHVRRPTGQSGPITLYWFSQTIGPNRGLEDVVRAMGLLADGTAELHLRGTWQTGYREMLLRVGQEAGLRADRIVAHEPAHPDDMVRLAAAFDVGLAVEPGTTANSDILLSNKVFTYLLAGVAIVATRTAGQQALLPSIDRAARSFHPGDVQALAQHLVAWVEDREALERARAAAWAYGESRYNWDREKRAFLDVVAQL